MMDFFELFQRIFDIINGTLDTLIDTANRIDSIQFDKTLMRTWLGYARYCMGDPLYILFTTTILISIGVALWTYVIKGIGYIMNLKPW